MYPAALATAGRAIELAGSFLTKGRDRLCLALFPRRRLGESTSPLGVTVAMPPQRFDELGGDHAGNRACTALPWRREAVAESPRRIRAELGVPAGRGKRYSWGYGACPDLDDHTIVFRLLPASDALGMKLTSAFQLVPEQSTAAMIVHHPEAKYYSIRETDRRGQTEPEGRSKPGLTESPITAPVLVTRSALLERLLDPESVVVFDGAMGTMLYARGVFINQCYDELNTRAPDLVRAVHAEYAQAGAEVLETNTFGANRVKLAVWPRGRTGDFQPRHAWRGILPARASWPAPSDRWASARAWPHQPERPAPCSPSR
jgi:hypothetical protein